MTIRRIIALIFVVAILGAGAYYLLRVEQEDEKNMTDLYATVEPLQKERDALVLEKQDLEEEYQLKMRDIGTVELLFREMNEQIFTDVYPVMREHGAVGTLGISSREYPGIEKRLNKEQYNRLLLDGWGSCLLYEKAGGRDFKTWYAMIKQRMDRDGLIMPTAVYFSEDNYDPSMDEDLISCGIQTVVVNVEDGHSNTVTSPSEDLWITGAMPWNYTGMKTDLEILSRTDGANLVYTIGFVNLWDAYEEESFKAVMEKWQEILAPDETLEAMISPSPTPLVMDPSLIETTQDKLYKQQIRSLSLDAARDAHLEAEGDKIELQKELEQRLAGIDSQIAALDGKIRLIYSEWGLTGNGTGVQ